MRCFTAASLLNLLRFLKRKICCEQPRVTVDSAICVENVKSNKDLTFVIGAGVDFDQKMSIIY